MALTLQDPNLVWQKVGKALSVTIPSGMTSASSSGASPITQNAFRALKLQFSTQKLNPALQFVPFGPADVDAATGYLPSLGACTIYAIYGKKTGTGTTKAFLNVFDKNTNGTSTDLKSVTLMFSGAGDESFAVSPTGWAYTNATGPSILSGTTVTGTTATTGDSDSQSGFLLVGA